MAIIKKFRIKTFKKAKPKIDLKNISLSFNKRQILDNISLKIQEGEIVGVLGPNGVGKSSLFNIIPIIPSFPMISHDIPNLF